MNPRNTLSLASITLALIASCGLPASGAPTPDGRASANAGPTSQRGSMSQFNQKMNIAKRALELSDEDVEIMSDAIVRPMVFVSKAGAREFTGELIVHAKARTAEHARARILPSMRKSSQFMDEFVVAVPQGLSEGELAAMLMATGQYEFVEPNWTLYPLVTPNDTQFSQSWQHNRLQSRDAWDLHTGDSDVIVAVCDSGVDTNHPDLQAALVPGYNAVDNLAQTSGGQIEDVNGHGTFVSGCAAAQGNNGTGVVGVGWDFSVMPIRVSNNGGGTASSFDILEGARWAVQQGAQIVNASFSGGSSSGNQTTAKYIIDRGGLLFWSSGNDNQFISYDGPDIVIVGSTTSSDNRSGFSNYGTAVDITAPGSSVRSTRNGGGYGNGSGTSYASPIAAGVGAMIFSVRSDLSGQDVQDILYRSVDDLGAVGRDDSFGRGRVNTLRAIETAQAYEPRLGLPLAESFDSESWMDVLSTTSGAVSTVIDAESTGAVLMLDSSDQVTTVQLGGRTLPSAAVYLGYGFKADGVEAGKSMTIDLLLEDNTWTTIFEVVSTGVDTEGFLPVSMRLPSSFLWHGVQLRFSAHGSDSSDQWLIDNVFINNENEPTPVAPLVDSFEGGLVSGLIWDEIDGPTVEISNNSHAATFSGEQSIESIDIPMAQYGIVPAYVRFDAWANDLAGADDVLTVEVRNILDDWIVVGTLDGQELTGNPDTFQFDTPLSAWFSDELRVRISSQGDDTLYIDNVYVGPDQLTGACSDADLAEPFGEIDFLDISLFLNAFNNNLPAGDLNGDGEFDFLDLSQFLGAYSAGCP